MLETGASAPGFELPGSDGSVTEPYDLKTHTESGPVVLLFYPFDFSPVCTEELCSFRDSEWLSVTPSVDVFGISTDSAYAHQEVINKHDLPFPLLSDHDGEVSDAYGVLADELEGHPQVSERAVFVIDSTETIRYAWQGQTYTDDPDIGEVSDAVDAVIGNSTAGELSF
jgi:peroxiredoxin